MDAIIDMLRGMRLNGGVFLDAEFSAPWCVSAEVGPEDCAPFTPTPRHIIAYHYVSSGRMLLEIDGQPAVAVEAGEVVVLPRNDPHRIGSDLRLRAISAEQLILPGAEGGLARIVHGGGGAATQILCGFLGSDLPRHALIAMLPAVLKVDAAQGAASGWVESSLRFAAQELRAGPHATPALIGKLAELLFMAAVQRYLAARPDLDRAWSAGLQDRVVARALGLLHARLEQRWTTAALADAVGLSRSAFAERFTRVTGHPPMRYLVQQRLARACALLRDTAEPVARIAYTVGYASEAAFNRAFKRAHGVAPAGWRREQPAASAPAPVEHRP